MDSNYEKVIKAAQLIHLARHFVCFTGAGISTPSGIPDFRSKGTGLWEKDDPMQVASASVFREDPRRFYNWFRPLVAAASRAKPNPAHQTLAKMEKSGLLKCVITQNIDGLHQRSGSMNVVELHGSAQKFTCAKCQSPIIDVDFQIKSLIQGSMPSCPNCSVILKPGITLFEEMLPTGAWNEAEKQMQMTDVLLVAGSSLEVSPASSLPFQALQQGSHLVIINFESTYLDSRADVVLPMDLAVILPLIHREIERLKIKRSH